MKTSRKVPKFSKYNKRSGIVWKNAPDIKKRVGYLLGLLEFEWIIKKDIYCIRSFGTKTRATARIWGLPKIWQMTINADPSYIIEVVAERFDNLDQERKDKVLLHEIAHIPKNFSGALVPHIRRGKRNFYDKVNGYISKYKFKL